MRCLFGADVLTGGTVFGLDQFLGAQQRQQRFEDLHPVWHYLLLDNPHWTDLHFGLPQAWKRLLHKGKKSPAQSQRTPSSGKVVHEISLNHQRIHSSLPGSRRLHPVISLFGAVDLQFLEP